MKKIFLLLSLLLFLASCSVDTQQTDISFSIDQGYRIDYGSNPRIIDYDGEKLKLAYEYQAEELMNNPSEKAYISESTDMINFEDNRKITIEEQKGPWLAFNNFFVRYIVDTFIQGIIYEKSFDEFTYISNDEICYDLTINDNGKIGVQTYYVFNDKIYFLYNHDEIIDNNEVIFVKMLTSDEECNFKLTNNDVLEYYYDDGTHISYADPNAIVLQDGRVLLITMVQEKGVPKPPAGRTGDIYGFISDDGVNFEPLGKLLSWEDFTEFEVYSLNDPKLIQLEDGTIKIYVAAMIPEDDTFKWIIVSATSK